MKGLACLPDTMPIVQDAEASAETFRERRLCAYGKLPLDGILINHIATEKLLACKNNESVGRKRDLKSSTDGLD